MLQFYRLCSARNFKSAIFSRTYSVAKRKNPGTELALSHFDQFYSKVFENWPSIRLGLLCPHSYCAVANTFADKKSSADLFNDQEVFNMKNAYYLQLGKPEDEDPILQQADDDLHITDYSPKTDLELHTIKMPVVDTSGSEYMPSTEYLQRDFDTDEFSDFYIPNVDYKAQVIKHGVLHYPENWEIYYFPRGKFKKFPSPMPDITGLLNYYLMDGASILPVLALDVQKGEDVGDLCASPGGKSLAILFTLRFGRLICNDASLSRVNKLKTVLSSYLPGTTEWSKKILVSNLDVCDWTCFDAFDKILLDVPCTNDRLSVAKDNNNIFQQKRIHERMQLPKTQTTMLCAALKALKKDGSLVYSTCSLSPIQNDGVVHMSLSNLSTTHPGLEFTVQDLSTAFEPLRTMFKFSDNCMYGQLVIPFLPLNYGPLYISKITRTK